MSRPKTSRTRQIECIAIALNKSKETIKAWCAEGLDPFNPDEIDRWFRYKNTRQRNLGPRSD